MAKAEADRSSQVKDVNASAKTETGFADSIRFQNKLVINHLYRFVQRFKHLKYA